MASRSRSFSDMLGGRRASTCVSPSSSVLAGASGNGASTSLCNKINQLLHESCIFASFISYLREYKLFMMLYKTDSNSVKTFLETLPFISGVDLSVY